MALDESEYIKEKSGPLVDKEKTWFKSGLPLNKQVENLYWMKAAGNSMHRTYFAYVN